MSNDGGIVAKFNLEIARVDWEANIAADISTPDVIIVLDVR